MAFSTVAKIRQGAGFVNNDNITDANITTLQSRAFNLIKSYVGARYDLNDLTGALFSGSPADEILKGLEELLAGGYLLLDEYGPNVDGDKNGQKKIDAAMKMLDDIKLGRMKLFDVNNDEIGSPQANRSVPISDTFPSTDDSPRKFSVDDEF